MSGPWKKRLPLKTSTLAVEGLSYPSAGKDGEKGVTLTYNGVVFSWTVL